ncbi:MULTISPECIES: SulP family inorganic anion transporter [Rhodobacterales]|jgi:SulP family sulfate permease|uniref:SulP family inorganic anion transporter n=1 Tax=Rhodobacterales TaxID=204455 RepID=UPI00237FB0E1|nr:SulP family inorganic anion transporter [Phaeobacter gallaeciensis]MDE4140573.1 SulP family inorganic anion transporter [Phaeobacter gallaeciensis]MDE4148734.1 SulP family inorganic anion transporter [Phaeobacter gallaeciensis]MDE4152956.1 SulP family inorganic anion transporter [Phaeobacter gallaeciensis]MDE4228630.1 SulP family inorganic anion transporter [Phaeobacter gallaeciensis]MDE4257706.1 SulP family inorganic anion transporter [Phaeobacter gallaeciensis]
MKRAAMALLANRISPPNLSIMQDEGWSVGRVRTELLSGLTVALALVPEAVAFAFVAGVHPLVGLYAAFMVGLITALIGGRPGMISGATGALAVVMVALVAEHGVEYLFATVVLMGILQVIAGVMHWGKFIRLVPHPVMLGFVNGLAIVIFLAQLTQFKVPGSGGTEWLSGLSLYMMLGLVALTMAIIWGTPKITSVIPAPLAGIGIVAILVIALGLDVPRVGDLASIEGGFPAFHNPFGDGIGLYGTALAPFNLETLEIILPYAVILAAIGLIESLLTLNLVGEITGKRGGASQECIAQGTSNIVTGFFGGMGGCAMIGQSMINVKSGGRTRIAGIAAALFLLTFIVVASPLIEQIPLAALVGVMFMVVIGTFAWNSLKIMTKVPLMDAFVIVLVTVVTVMTDLAIAVVVGVIVSALAYAWNNARRIHARTRESASDKGAKVYEIEGPLFFGSTDGFIELFDVAGDPERVIVDFANSRVVDQSALQAIEALAGKYEEEGKTIVLRHLSRDCHQLLSKAGHLMVDSDDDPEYALAVDYSVKTGVLGGH